MNPMHQPLISGATAGKSPIPDSTISLLVMARASATFLKREFDHSEPEAFQGQGLSIAKFQSPGI
jgi:hypothetical protein